MFVLFFYSECLTLFLILAGVGVSLPKPGSASEIARLILYVNVGLLETVGHCSSLYDFELG